MITITNFCPRLTYRCSHCSPPASGVGIRLKVGDKYWEEWRGGVWGGAVPWRGCALPSWGSGACPQKKNQCCAKIMQFWASFGTSFLHVAHVTGDSDTTFTSKGQRSTCRGGAYLWRPPAQLVDIVEQQKIRCRDCMRLWLWLLLTYLVLSLVVPH